MRLTKNLGPLAHFLCGAVVASVLGGTALGITSPTFTYSSTQIGFLTINPFAMANRYVTPSLASMPGSGCYLSGVNLPQGAGVLDVTTWYKSGRAGDVTVYLYRQDMQTNQYSVPIRAIVRDDTNKRKAVTNSVPADFRAVDNARFLYGYAVCVGSDGQFSGARIRYQFRNAGG